jgi:hypothetical protein
MASRRVMAGLVLGLTLAACGCATTSVQFDSTGPVLLPREGTVDVLYEQPAGCTVLGRLSARADGNVQRTALIRRMQSEAAQHGGDAIVLTDEQSKRVSGLQAGTYGGYLGHRDSRTMEAVAIKR